jgi:hypothetical protein
VAFTGLAAQDPEFTPHYSKKKKKKKKSGPLQRSREGVAWVEEPNASL